MICSKCKKDKLVCDFMVSIYKKGKPYYSHCKQCHSEYTSKSTTDLSDKYIIQLLTNAGHKNIEDGLIELKRQSIKLKRMLWQISKT